MSIGSYLSGTNDLFWDCECIVNYIHPKTQISCKKCKAVSWEQPDSRDIELIKEGILCYD